MWELRAFGFRGCVIGGMSHSRFFDAEIGYKDAFTTQNHPAEEKKFGRRFRQFTQLVSQFRNASADRDFCDTFSMMKNHQYSCGSGAHGKNSDAGFDSCPGEDFLPIPLGSAIRVVELCRRTCVFLLTIYFVDSIQRTNCDDVTSQCSTTSGKGE